MLRKTKRCGICGEVHVLADFPTQNARKDKHGSVCKICKAKTERVNYMKNRKKWLGFIGADNLSCECCGYNKNFIALQHHHRDPSLKDKIVSKMFMNSFTEANKQWLLNEMKKCTVLCSNCHDIFHGEYGLKDFTESDLNEFLKENKV